MKKVSAFLLIVSIIFFQSCEKIHGDGPIVKETRSAEQFNGIDLQLDAELNYTSGSVYKVEINAQQNILQAIETSVSNKILKIKVRNSTHFHSYHKIIINISSPEINEINMGGSGSINVWQANSPSYCKLRLSGSGDINVANLITSNLEAELSGSGKIKVNGGTVSTQQLKVSGSGLVDLLNMNAATAISTISGSGIIRTNLSQSLDATISGSGNIYYLGNIIITSRISGSGKIIKL